MSTKDHVAVRLDPETVRRIDALRPFLDTAWRDARRSDVLRLLLLDGLQRFEKKHQAELGVTPGRSRRRAETPAQPARRPRKKTKSPPSAE